MNIHKPKHIHISPKKTLCAFERNFISPQQCVKKVSQKLPACKIVLYSLKMKSKM